MSTSKVRNPALSEMRGDVINRVMRSRKDIEKHLSRYSRELGLRLAAISSKERELRRSISGYNERIQVISKRRGLKFSPLKDEVRTLQSTDRKDALNNESSKGFSKTIEVDSEPFRVFGHTSKVHSERPELPRVIDSRKVNNITVSRKDYSTSHSGRLIALKPSREDRDEISNKDAAIQRVRGKHSHSEVVAECEKEKSGSMTKPVKAETMHTAVATGTQQPTKTPAAFGKMATIRESQLYDDEQTTYTKLKFGIENTHATTSSNISNGSVFVDRPKKRNQVFASHYYNVEQDCKQLIHKLLGIESNASDMTTTVKLPSSGLSIKLNNNYLNPLNRSTKSKRMKLFNSDLETIPEFPNTQYKNLTKQSVHSHKSTAVATNLPRLPPLKAIQEGHVNYYDAFARAPKKQTMDNESSAKQKQDDTTRRLRTDFDSNRDQCNLKTLFHRSGLEKEAKRIIAEKRMKEKLLSHTTYRDWNRTG